MSAENDLATAMRRLTEKVEVLNAERGAPGRAAVRVDQINNIVQQAVTAALNAAGIFSGAGSPEGNVPAKVGAIYRNPNGGPGTTFYVKESGGSGPTGWAAK